MDTIQTTFIIVKSTDTGKGLDPAYANRTMKRYNMFNLGLIDFYPQSLEYSLSNLTIDQRAYTPVHYLLAVT